MVDEGDIGIMQYSGDHYIFTELSDVEIGETGLLVPMPGDDYRVVKLASDAEAGELVTIVSDRKGNYYAVK